MKYFNTFVALCWLLNLIVFVSGGELSRFTVGTALFIVFGFFVSQSIDGFTK